MPIRDNDPRPAYEQLADELRQAINEGEYAPGDKLPSTRELTESYGIAPMTVRRALDVLEQEHLVMGRQGRGVFVLPQEPQPAGDPLERVQASLDKTMKMLQGINERLDRYDADRGASKEPAGKDAALDPMAGIDATLAEITKNLAVANEALGADDLDLDLGLDLGPAPGLDLPPQLPEPDRGPDLGL